MKIEHNFFKVCLFSTIIIGLILMGPVCAGENDSIHNFEINSYVYTDVSVTQAKQMLDTEDIFLLDVRTQSEFDEGHIKYANLIGVTQLPSRLDEVPNNETILVYCKSGGRSASASSTLAGAGYTDVYNMEGGITAWKAAGYPVVTYDIYDENENYVIDIEEISTSIDDYFMGQLSISKISQLVDYFLSGDEYC